MQILNCQQCKTDFYPKRVNHVHPKKFCSIACSSLAKVKRISKSCDHCGTETLNEKFCSKSCAATYNNKGVRRNYAKGAIYKTVKVRGVIRTAKINTCSVCEAETPNRKYCSEECNPRRLTHLTIEQKNHRHTAMHREAWQRYQAKLKNQTPDNVNKKALQEFYLNCPEGYEVDHIIPVSKGGLHCLSNLQYLTISENRKKSNKIL